MFCISRECIDFRWHNLKAKQNKKYSNLVDSSCHSLKVLLGIPAKEIPAEFRIAMFNVFKTRRLIK